MDIGQTLRKSRQLKQLSQIEVARRSRISLATIQNIEAGKANPSWSTLTVLLKVLGLKFRLQTNAIDWSLLAALGCPILTESDLIRPTRDLLIETVIDLEPPLTADERNLNALAAWLLSLKDHYPSIWKLIKPQTKAWVGSSIPCSIKLRRLALSNLGVYL